MTGYLAAQMVDGIERRLLRATAESLEKRASLLESQVWLRPGLRGVHNGSLRRPARRVRACKETRHNSSCSNGRRVTPPLDDEGQGLPGSEETLTGLFPPWLALWRPVW